MSTLRSGYMTPRMGTQPLGRGPAVGQHKSTPRLGTPTHRPMPECQAWKPVAKRQEHNTPTDQPFTLYPGGTALSQGLPALAILLSTPSRGLLTGFSQVTHATCLTSCLFLSYEPALVSLNHAAPAGPVGGQREKSSLSSLTTSRKSGNLHPH